MKTKKLKANAVITRRLADKRIAIAEDVIAQIKANAYLVATSIYVRSPAFCLPDNRRGDLQQIIKENITPRHPCTVCALGSCFISAVRLYDKVQVVPTDFIYDAYKPWKLKNLMYEFFKKSELELIEASFEGSCSFIYTDRRREALLNATVYTDFLASFVEYEDRLCFLMDAVISADKQDITLDYMQSYMLRSLAEGRYDSYRQRLLSISTLSLLTERKCEQLPTR